MTYPNVLVMGYLKATGQLTPETRATLESALGAGYQRLLSFEATGGGFDWYGGGTAKTLLTAYGMHLLSDLDKVHPIDRRVIDRAREVLYARQNTDGSWTLDGHGHRWTQVGGGRLPTTAYIAWSLAEAGAGDERLERARAWLAKQELADADPYVLALVALARGDRATLGRLEGAAQLRGDEAEWSTAGEGLYHARGAGASIEATALAALALLREGRSPLIDKALTKLARSKGAGGYWSSTQATVLCIKALLEATKGSPKPARPNGVRLVVNGREVAGAFRPLTAANHDVVQQVEIPVVVGENRIELTLQEEARLSWQVHGRYYLPWDQAPALEPSALSITLRYDRSELSLTEGLRATATLEQRGPETFMVIADLGIPPGFVPDPSSFEALVGQGVIDKFSVTGRQILLYFGRVPSGSRQEIRYTLSPRFPIRARAPRSEVYEYYSPQNRATAPPQLIRVLAD